MKGEGLSIVCLQLMSLVIVSDVFKYMKKSHYLLRLSLILNGAMVQIYVTYNLDL